MVALNRSRAGRLNSNAVVDNPFLGDAKFRTMGGYFFDAGKVEREVTYHNESFHNVSVIDGTGVTLDLPAARTTKHQMVFTITYRWGHEVQFNPAASLMHSPNPNEEVIQRINDAIRNVSTTMPRELTLYYTVDLTNIEKDPFGIWLEPLNIQIVSTRYAKTTTFFTKDCFFNKNDELFKLADQLWSTSVTLAYFVDDTTTTENLFVVLGNDVLEVKPIYRPDVNKGLYINLRGEVGFAAGSGNKKQLMIEPDKFKLYGIYSSYRELEEAVKFDSKGMSKDEVKRRTDVFERIHGLGSLGNAGPPRSPNIRDINVIGDYSIGSFIDFLGEASKVVTFVEKHLKK